MQEDKKIELWHVSAGEDILKMFNVSAEKGLDSKQAAERLEKYGFNELSGGKKVSALSLLIEQFKNVLILILLGASVLSGFLGHGLEAGAIAVIVLFAVLLGFIQEYRAEKAIDSLKKMAAPTALAMRDGQEIEIAARNLVPGDIIIISTGDKIPADARLIKAINLKIEEAALTGESIPVEKKSEGLAQQDLPLGDRKNMVFAGTAATYGRGLAVVVATAMQTEFGKIAHLLESVEASETPLQKNLDKIGKNLAKIAFCLVVVVIALGLLRSQPFLELFIFGIALAVAVVPEALPAVVTISLAIGVQRMVKRNALVRRLPAVETLGATTIICSDKTGTLTKDEMTTRKILLPGVGIIDISGSGYEPSGDFKVGSEKFAPSVQLLGLLEAGLLASDAHIKKHEGQWEVSGDPTEGALVVAAAKAGLDKAVLDDKFVRLAELPFSSETKRMSTLHRYEATNRIYSKGALEVILNACKDYRDAKNTVPLDEETRKNILQAGEDMSREALRVIAVATADITSIEIHENNLTFLGLFGMIDPPRPEAKQAIETCKKAGIKLAMITGDHPITAQAIALELGLLQSGGKVVIGTEIEKMSDEELERDIESISVFARVSPAHKLRIVSMLQKHGHIVAMTGDGVNDAPALKKADIGIAMGIAGTDVTKEASDMMLTNDNFASIVSAVEEGRIIFGNIKKYLMYLLSSNIGEMGLMIGSSLLGLPLPLSAVQILYVNLATDGLPALALAVDPPSKGIMEEPPRPSKTGIFTKKVTTLIAVGGLASTLLNLSLFVWAYRSGRSAQEAMTMVFVSLVLIQFFKAYSFRSEQQSVFKDFFTNKWLNRAVGWELLLLVLIIYVPFLQKTFNTFSLTKGDWLIVISCAFLIIPALEIAKRLQRRGSKR